MGIDFHDVPEDRFAADIHHWLWFEFRFFFKPVSQSPGKDDCFHYRTL
jgi:hypothetical protein